MRPRRTATVASLLATAALVGCGSSAPTATKTTAATTATTTGTAATTSTAATTTTKKAASGVLAAGCRATRASDQTVRTPTYVFLLHVGARERMLMITAAEAKAKHVTSGELMIGGSSASMPSGGMNGHATTHHLEVHICDRATVQVVADAMPSITAVPASGGRPEDVPVMVMQGVTAGSADLHYGNNVPLRPGARYRITVKLGAVRAVFIYSVPRGV